MPPNLPFTELTPALISLAFMISLRVIPVIALVPMGRQHFHWQIRITLVVLTTLLLTSFHSDNQALLAWTGDSYIPPIPMMVSELLTGLALGASILVAIEGIQLGAQWMGLSSGVSFKTTNHQSAIAKFVSLATLAALVASGLHRVVITAILDCYTWIPPGTLQWDSPEGIWHQHISMTLTWSFLLGLKLAAPVMIAMLAVNLTTGWISRQSPHFHQFVIGIPANTAILLVVIMMTLGTVTLAMQQEITTVLDRITQQLF